MASTGGNSGGTETLRELVNLDQPHRNYLALDRKRDTYHLTIHSELESQDESLAIASPAITRVPPPTAYKENTTPQALWCLSFGVAIISPTAGLREAPAHENTTQKCNLKE
jgi:hypothetical protein